MILKYKYTVLYNYFKIMFMTQLQKSATSVHLKMMKSFRGQSSGESCVLTLCIYHEPPFCTEFAGHADGLCMLMVCLFYYSVACPTLFCCTLISVGKILTKLFRLSRLLIQPD